MSKVRTNSGNLALDNIALIKYIANIDFKSVKSGLRKGSTTGRKSVCYTLASFRNNTTGQCNPSIDRIAHCSGCSKDTAMRILNDLVELDVLIRVNITRVGSNIKNHYYFRHDMVDLIEMFDDEDHEIHKTNQVEWVESAISEFRYLN